VQSDHTTGVGSASFSATVSVLIEAPASSSPTGSSLPSAEALLAYLQQKQGASAGGSAPSLSNATPLYTAPVGSQYSPAPAISAPSVESIGTNPYSPVGGATAPVPATVSQMVNVLGLQLDLSDPAQLAEFLRRGGTPQF
jgi:hypothetical protein